MFIGVDTKVATEIGLNEAIMLGHIAYWVKKNAADGRDIYEGRAWTYNSLSTFEKLFPFWSRATVKRLLKSLKDNGFIVTGNFNKLMFDRTSWYSVTEKGIELLGESIAQYYIDGSISAYREGQNEPMDRVNLNQPQGQNEPMDRVKMTPPCGQFDPNNTKDNTKITTVKNSETTSPLPPKGKKRDVFEEYTTNAELLDSLRDFENMRKSIKKPLQDSTKKRLLSTLDKLASDDETKIAIVNQSIDHNWQGLFPLDERKHIDNRIKPQTTPNRLTADDDDWEGLDGD